MCFGPSGSARLSAGFSFYFVPSYSDKCFLCWLQATNRDLSPHKLSDVNPGTSRHGTDRSCSLDAGCGTTCGRTPRFSDLAVPFDTRRLSVRKTSNSGAKGRHKGALPLVGERGLSRESGFSRSDLYRVCTKNRTVGKSKNFTKKIC